MKTNTYTFNWNLTDDQISIEMDSFIESNFENRILIEL